MKRIAVLVALAFLVLGFSAPRANAVVICLDYTAFCDRMEVEIKSGKVVAGNFDRGCDNTFSQPVVGVIRFGSANFAGGDIVFGPPMQNLVDHDIAARTHDFWFWDGTTLKQQAFDSPFTVTAGACPVVSINGAEGVPRGLPE